MKPEIIEREPAYIVGMSFYGDPFSQASAWSEENAIGKLCKRFTSFYESHPKDFVQACHPDVFFEIHIQTEETQTLGYHEVFAGVEVSQLHIPMACSAKKLPGGLYAKFTLHGEEIVNDWWNAFFHEWLPESGYEVNNDFSILSYDERYKGVDHISESDVDVLIPVKKL